jgi:hypothetical protein
MEAITMSEAERRYKIGRSTLRELEREGRLTVTDGVDRHGREARLLDPTQLQALGYALRRADGSGEFLEERVERISASVCDVRRLCEEILVALTDLRTATHECSGRVVAVEHFILGATQANHPARQADGSTLNDPVLPRDRAVGFSPEHPTDYSSRATLSSSYVRRSLARWLLSKVLARLRR